MAIALLILLGWPPGWQEEEKGACREEGSGQAPSLAGGDGAKQLPGMQGAVLRWSPGQGNV